MAKKPETVFKERVQKDLKTIKNLWCFKVDQRALRGIPDIVGFVNGYGFAIELKKSDAEDPDPLQHYVLQQVEKAGALSWVATPENWDIIFDSLKILSHHAPIERRA